jgi:prepilin peptidase CpaA
MFSQSQLGLFPGLAFIGLLVYACVRDVTARRIPNDVVLALALCGMLVSMATHGIGLGAWKASAAIATGLALWLPFHAARLLGAGDVKLFAAASGWLGVPGSVEAAIIAALAGGVLAVAWLLRERGTRPVARVLGVWFGASSWGAGVVQTGEPTSRPRLPYGLALATGLIAQAMWPGIIFGR